MQGRLDQRGLGLQPILSVCTATRAKGCNNEECGGAEEQTNRQICPSYWGMCDGEEVSAFVRLWVRVRDNGRMDSRVRDDYFFMSPGVKSSLSSLICWSVNCSYITFTIYINFKSVADENLSLKSSWASQTSKRIRTPSVPAVFFHTEILPVWIRSINDEGQNHPIWM